jgi:hypothetical protein
MYAIDEYVSLNRMVKTLRSQTLYGNNIGEIIKKFLKKGELK